MSTRAFQHMSFSGSSSEHAAGAGASRKVHGGSGPSTRELYIGLAVLTLCAGIAMTRGGPDAGFAAIGENGAVPADTAGDVQQATVGENALPSADSQGATMTAAQAARQQARAGIVQ